jgi:hypothetical protein
MPRGKAAIVGAIGWSHARVLPETVGDPQLLLRWKLPQHRGPTSEESEGLREQIRDVLGSYFGYKASTPLLTETERRKLISMTQRGKIHPEVLDVNTRAIIYRRQRHGHSYEPRGRVWVDPLLVDPVNELARIWETATGRSPRTRDSLDLESRTGFYFYDWMAQLFKACGKQPPAKGTIRDILANPKLEKSGP